MKKSIKAITLFFLGFLFCLTFVVTYANSYNSEEISYDTSTSGAVQANVKDALDFLYNKTKSGAASECPENMSCVEKPGVVMSVSGPGTVDKGTVYVGLNESNTFSVTPNEGYTLHSISCDNGYTLGSFKTLSTEATSSQEITITNPGTTNGASCSITFSTNEITIATSGSIDTCNNAGVNCACYYIYHYGNRESSFSYNGHTGCNFTSKVCKYSLDFGGASTECAKLTRVSNTSNWCDDTWCMVTCSGVITCAT